MVKLPSRIHPGPKGGSPDRIWLPWQQPRRENHRRTHGKPWKTERKSDEKIGWRNHKKSHLSRHSPHLKSAQRCSKVYFKRNVECKSVRHPLLPLHPFRYAIESQPPSERFPWSPHPNSLEWTMTAPNSPLRGRACPFDPDPDAMDRGNFTGNSLKN